MMLFDKDKEIIFKITNAILLIWFIGALLFTFSNLIDMFLDRPYETYDSYKQYSCVTYDKEMEKPIDEDLCLNNYNRMKDEDSFYQKKSFLISLVNTITVFLALFFLNKPRKKIK